jgi:hypothetical protein
MAMNSGPTDEQRIGGEIARGDRRTSGRDRVQEARVGDIGSPHPVVGPETASETEGDAADVALGGGVPSGEAPNSGGEDGRDSRAANGSEP